MNTKEKSCENCANKDKSSMSELCDKFSDIAPDRECCTYWQRNPDLWLDIPPEEMDEFYWVCFGAEIGKGFWPQDVGYIFKVDGETMIRLLHSNRDHKLSWLKNLRFQGPIRPKEET